MRKLERIITILLILAMLVIIFWDIKLYELGFIFILLGILALCIYNWLTGKITSLINKHKKVSLIFVTTVGFVVILLASLFPQYTSEILSVDISSNILEGKDLFGYYIAQLSLTFISISVLSVLSDKSVRIYWANVSEDMLIKPTFKCFAAYTYYSIGASIGSGLGVVIDNGLVFAAFFAVNIIIMVVLTLSMIDVYYGRDAKMKKMQKELEKDFNAVQAYNKNILSDEATKLMAYGYRDKMLGLRQHIYNANANSDFSELREIYGLYVLCFECFKTKEGEAAVETMVETVDSKNLALFLNYAVSNHVANLILKDDMQKKDYSEGKEYCFNYTWNVDEKLWQEIYQNQFLRECFTGKVRISKELLRQFFSDINLRMAMLYNHLVLAKEHDCRENGKKFNVNEYLISAYSLDKVRLPNNKPLTKEKIIEVFDEYNDLFEDENGLVKSALKLMVLFEGDDSLGKEEIDKMVERFPFLPAFYDKVKIKEF